MKGHRCLFKVLLLETIKQKRGATNHLRLNRADAKKSPRASSRTEIHPVLYMHKRFLSLQRTSSLTDIVLSVALVVQMLRSVYSQKHFRGNFTSHTIAVIVPRS